MSSQPGSVTQWIDQLKAGHAAAAQPLWQDYFARPVGLARHKLRGASRVAVGSEDVALSAFDSLCRGAAAGRFPQLADRHDLWRLLFVITERKAADCIKHERTKKRGGGKVRHASELDTDSSVTPGLDRFPGREPTPLEAAQVAEECRRLLNALGDGTLRAVAVAKMEGYTNQEIAARRRCSLATIERKLVLIRKTWQKEIPR
jgi:DNA-directed RNA polymerase specialized sigma24 family protein